MNIEELLVTIRANTSQLQKELKKVNNKLSDTSDATDALEEAFSKTAKNGAQAFKDILQAADEYNSAIKAYSKKWADFEIFPNFKGSEPWKEAIVNIQSTYEDFKDKVLDSKADIEDIFTNSNIKADDNLIAKIFKEAGSAEDGFKKVKAVYEEVLTDLQKGNGEGEIWLTSGLVNLAMQANETKDKIVELTNKIKEVEQYNNGGQYKVKGSEQYNTVNDFFNEFGSIDAAKQKLQELTLEYGNLSREIGQTKQSIADSIPTETIGKLDSIKNAWSSFFKSFTENETTLAGNLSVMKAGFAELGSTILMSIQGIAKLGASIASSVVPALLKAGKAVGSFTISLGKAFLEMNPIHLAVKKLGQSLKSLATRVKRVLVYSTIVSFFRQVKSEISSYLSTNEELMGAIGKAKGAWLTAFQPIISAVIPIIKQLIDWLTKLGYAFANLTSKLFGGTVKSNQDAAKAMYETAHAADAAGAAAKRQLAAFDELNVLQDQSSGGSSELGATEFGDFEEPKEYKSWGDWYSDFLDKIIAKLPAFNELMEKAGTAINDFSGNLLEMFTFVDEKGQSVDDKMRSIGEGIANAFNTLLYKVNWDQLGQAIGAGIDNILNLLVGFVSKFDWQKLGSSITESISGCIKQINWTNIGYLFVKFFTNVWDILIGAIHGLDFGAVGKALSDGIISIFNTASNWLSSINWQSLGQELIQKCKDLISNIDWGQVISTAFQYLGSALGAASGLFVGLLQGALDLLSNAWESVKGYFNEKIEECGGNVIAGFFKGIIDAIAGVGQWIVDHIFTPFIDGFKSVFGIASPSTVMAELGGYIVEGLFQGISLSEFWQSIQNWFTEKLNNMKQWCSDTWNSIKDTATSLWNQTKDNVGNIVNTLKTNIENKWTTLKTNISNYTQQLKTDIENKWSTMKTNISTFTDNLKSKVSTTWDNMKTTVSTKTQNLKETIEDKWTKMKEKVNDLTETLKTNLHNKFSNLYTDTQSQTNTGLNNTKTLWSKACSAISGLVGDFGTNTSSNFNSTMSNLGDVVGDALGISTENWSAGLSDMLKSGSTFGTKITQYFSDLAQKIADAMTNGANGGVNALNGLVSAYKRAKAEDYANQVSAYNARVSALQALGEKILPSFVYKAFRAISLPSLSSLIPHFADGGVLTSPTIGLMGEYPGARSNPEIVTPKDLLTDVVNGGNDELIDVMIQLGRQIVTAINNKDLEVSIGDDDIVKSVQRGNSSVLQRTGKNILGY